MLVALISDVFFEGRRPGRGCCAGFEEAKAGGAEMALLPEIPLNPWSPATATPNPERCRGGRTARGSRCSAPVRARRSIGVVGGAIVIDPSTGKRHNTALVFDEERDARVVLQEGAPAGRGGISRAVSLRARYRSAGCRSWIRAAVRDSDLLGHEPAGGISSAGGDGRNGNLQPSRDAGVNVRALEAGVSRNALTSTAYVLSVARPAPEQGVPLGGASSRSIRLAK